MKKHFAVLSITIATLLGAPALFAEDVVPPKPPGSDTAPAAPAAATPASPSTQNPGSRSRMSPEERLKKMTEVLGLTQDQQDKIKGIFEKYTPQMKELFSKGFANLTDEDKTKARELLKTQSEEIAAVLTPEQKEKYKAAMEKRQAARAKQQQ
jgi:Spy/CpxP family protein refolding chaperone